MRIAIFTESFLPQVNGVVTATLNLTKALSKKHEVEIYTVGKGPSQAAGCSVHRFKGRRLPTYPDYRFFVPSRSMKGILAKANPDIIHMRSSVGLGIVAYWLARKRGIPLVGTFDTPISDYVHYLPFFGKFGVAKSALSGIARRYTAWLYNKCDVVIAPSPTAKKWLKETGCKSKTISLSNGVDTSRFSPKEKSNKLRKGLCKDNELLLLHIGRITKEKSINVLVKSARLAKDQGIPFKLVIGGKGPYLNEAKQLSRELNVNDHVTFLGFIQATDLPRYYSTADAFVTASTVETEGIVLLEAMASGTPVIGPRAGAIPAIIKNQENGMLFSPNSASGLARQISSMAKTSITAKLSKGALRKSKDYSISIVAKKIESVYLGLVKS